MTNGTPKKAGANPPLSAQTYAIISLAGLIIGIGLLFFYVYEVPRLVESGVQNQVLYLLLIPWALASAAFLFGAMRSYARFTHRHLGSVLELGGPVVLFCLVVVGGFKLVPQPAESFDLTVRAHSADGRVPIITSGKITLELENTRRTEDIGPGGEANFKGIPAKFKGTTVRLLPEADAYKLAWQQRKLLSNTLDLALEKADQPVTHLIGSIVPPPDDWKKIGLTVDSQSSEGKVDELGRFDFPVNGRPSDRIRLKIYAGSKLLYDDFQTLPGPVNLTLH